MTNFKVEVQVTFVNKENASQQTEKNAKDVKQVGSGTGKRWHGLPAIKSWVFLLIMIIKSFFS